MKEARKEILDLQSRYGFELVNNSNFIKWAKTPGFEGFGGRGDLEPAWNQEMANIFGDPAKGYTAEPLRTVDQVAEAMNKLFWYRESYGYEAAVMFDMPWFPPEEYAMCSRSTQELARIYTQDYMSGLCCNDRVINEPPMMDRLTEWIHSNYK